MVQLVYCIFGLVRSKPISFICSIYWMIGPLGERLHLAYQILNIIFRLIFSIHIQFWMNLFFNIAFNFSEICLINFRKHFTRIGYTKAGCAFEWTVWARNLCFFYTVIALLSFFVADFVFFFSFHTCQLQSDNIVLVNGLWSAVARALFIFCHSSSLILVIFWRFGTLSETALAVFRS